MHDIVLIALRAEAPSLFKYTNVFEIGVGKVNAAIAASAICEIYKPKRIINIGTAGGVKLDTGIYRVNHVFQHDVNLTSLGLAPGQILSDPYCFIDIPGSGYTCATGDIHVTEKHKMRLDCDMVDMEAFSVAKVCVSKNIKCEIWKFISDQADENAATSWQEQVAAGEKFYYEILKDLKVVLL